MPGSAVRSCGAEASMTESPIAVTCLPVISGDAERPGLGVAPAGAGAWPGACAWPGAGFAGLAALLWALGDRVAALTLSPCATCRISPEVLLLGALRTLYPAVHATVAAATVARTGRACTGERWAA